MQSTHVPSTENFQATFILSLWGRAQDYYENLQSAAAHEKLAILQECQECKEKYKSSIEPREKIYQKVKKKIQSRVESLGLQDWVRYHDVLLIIELNCGPTELEFLLGKGQVLINPKNHNGFEMTTAYRRKLNNEIKALTETFNNHTKNTFPNKEIKETFFTNEEEFISTCLTESDGICIGENHLQTSSKLFLIQNMPYLKSQGVTTLFIEHLLYDRHQSFIDAYMQSPPDTPMPPALLFYLENLYSTFENGKMKVSLYKKVIETAKENGIRVIAIDTSATYSISSSSIYEFNEKRTAVMNCAMIERFQTHDDKGKYIVFVGNTHAVYCKSIPGISELLNCISINIQDTDTENPYPAVIRHHTISSHSSFYQLSLNFHYSYFKHPDQAFLNNEAYITDIQPPLLPSPSFMLYSRTSPCDNYNAAILATYQSLMSVYHDLLSIMSQPPLYGYGQALHPILSYLQQAAPFISQINHIPYIQEYLIHITGMLHTISSYCTNESNTMHQTPNHLPLPAIPNNIPSIINHSSMFTAYTDSTKDEKKTHEHIHKPN